MKERAPVIRSDSAQRPASAHAGATAAPDGPRMQAQEAQIAQLRSAGGDGPAQLTSRQTSNFNLGKSHSKVAATGKTTSHQSGKPKVQKPSISAAKNNKRRREMAAKVANSQAKAANSTPK
jgi:hypothetical protein